MAQNLTYIQDGTPVDIRQKKREAAKEKAEMQKGDDIGEFEGVIAMVKEDGTQRIKCDKLLEQGWEWDATIEEKGVDYEFGDTVLFTAFQTNGGRLKAKNVSLIEAAYLGAFVGEVKSFNDATGYGFIACEDIKM